MEDEELMRIRNNPEFYEDTLEYQQEQDRNGQIHLNPSGMDQIFQTVPEDDEKSTNS